MRRIDYQRLYEWSFSRERLISAMRIISVPAVAAVVVAFVVFVARSALVYSLPRALTVLAVSGIPFLLVSLLRRLLGAKRPHELIDLEALPRHGCGDSFPLRHAFSAFHIGALILPELPVLGAAVLLLGVYISLSRVLLGIHFIRDVLAGAITGVATGIIGAVCIYFFA